MDAYALIVGGGAGWEMPGRENRARARALLRSTALAGAAAGALIAAPAFAADECGAPDQGSVTCTAAGNPYSGGIAYTSQPVNPGDDPSADPTVPVYDLTVTLADGVLVQSGANPGVSITGVNTGAATLDAVAGTKIRATGFGAAGVLGATDAGDLTINTSSVATSGAFGDGIEASSNSGAITIDAGQTRTRGALATGISTTSVSGNIDITVGSVATAGYYAEGIRAYSDTGDVTIHAGTVATTGGSLYFYGSTGIDARSGSAAVDVTAQTVSTTGDYADGIIAVSFGAGGVATVDAGDVTTSGFASAGVFVQGATATLDVGNITTTGDYSAGAVMFGTGAGGATLTSTGTISTAGDYATGASVKAFYGGTASVTVGSVSTTGDNSPAVYAYGASAEVTVNGAVSTSGTNSPGVIAVGYYGAATVTNNGSVTTTGDGSLGIYAGAYYDVTIAGPGTVSTSGFGARGIVAYSVYGNVTVTAGDVTTTGDLSQGIRATANGYGVAIQVNAGSVTTSGDLSDGIAAVSRFGDITITSTGTLSTSGEYAFGTYGVSTLGDTTIVVNNVTTTGDDSVGVLAAGYNASVTVNGAVTTSGTVGAYGAGAAGIEVVGRYGTADATINGSVTTSGDLSTGVFIQGYYETTVTNAGVITTTGYAADGIRAGSYYGNVVVHNTGAVATSGDASRGIAATSYYDLTIDGAGTVTTSGVGATAIVANAAQTTSVTAGTVATTGDLSTAIYAYGGLGVTVDAATVSTSGDDANGILALSYGDVSVTAGSVSTAGDDSDGIVAASFGDGATVSVTAGNVTVTGVDSNAIDAIAYGGAVDVGVTGNVFSAHGDAVSIDAATTAAVDIAAGGSVVGGIDGIAVSSADGSVITNAGAINARDGFAIDATGGAAVIHNSGLIRGAVSLTTGDDRIDNSGVFAASGTSDFGEGDDVFVNSGTLRLASASAAQDVVFANLEQFNNSGVVDLRNGIVGDTLTLPGAYVGAGGTFGLDVRLGGPATTGDLLNVGTAAGSTRVALTTYGGYALLTPGTTIVQASAASSPDAFNLPGGVQQHGLIDYQIVYRPGSFAYQLVGTPDATVFHTLKAAEGAQALWYRSADAVTSHLTMLRDGEWQASDAKGGVWLEMFGGLDKRREREGHTIFGVSRAVDSSYKQDYFGAQVGADFGSASDGGGFVFGVTAGYQNSTLRFSYDGDRFEYDALNAGVYAGFKAGPLFVNGLAKYDHYTITAHSPLAGFRDHFDGHGYGAQLEAGVRLGSDSLFFEPVASIAYVRTDLDDLQALGQTIDFDRMDGLRGKAGLRLGSNSTIGGGNRLTAYVSGMAVHEFDGRDGIAFVSGPTTLHFDNRRLGTYGQGTVGFSITTPGGVTGFIEGTGDYNKNYRGGGGRAGIRVKF